MACGFLFVFLVTTVSLHTSIISVSDAQEPAAVPNLKIADAVTTPLGIEAIGPMQWFLNLLEELGIECQVGDATKIRAAEPRKQKHDRRDAELILKLLVEKCFPTIWMPSQELLDLRALLLHRHPGVGPVTALATEAFLGNPQRFADGKALASYVGLIPREHSSRARQRLGALTKQGSPFLRFVWGEAGAGPKNWRQNAVEVRGRRFHSY
jgi:transposase